MDGTLDKTLPVKKPSSITRLIFFVGLSAMLMAADHRGNHLETIRSALSVFIYPVQILSAIPAQIGNWASEALKEEESVREELEKLKSEMPPLMARLQKYEALEQENERLRIMLKSADRVSERVIVAELLEVHPEPFTRTMIISKGSKDQVYPGQPVIDAFGIIGQVTQVNLMTSSVTLLTDASHSIPVQINRNGLRTIVVGSGSSDVVEVPYLTASADIRIGDLLVTSGMGRRFPRRYPVAVVENIVNDPNEPFLRITAKPKSHLNSGTEVMLIWTKQEQPPVKKAADEPKDKK